MTAVHVAHGAGAACGVTTGLLLRCALLPVVLVPRAVDAVLATGLILTWLVVEQAIDTATWLWRGGR